METEQDTDRKLVDPEILRKFPPELQQFITPEIVNWLDAGEVVAISTGDGTVIAHSLDQKACRAEVRKLPSGRPAVATIHPSFGPNKMPPPAIIRGHSGVRKAVESTVGSGELREHELVPDEILDQHGVPKSEFIRKDLTWEVWNLLQRNEIVAIVMDSTSDMYKRVVAHAATEDECRALLTEFQEKYKQEKGEVAPMCCLLFPPYGVVPGSEKDPIPACRGRGNIWS